MKHIHFI